MNEPALITTPFKFLDAYGKQDRDIFFGRDAEIAELYERIFESNLIVLYGASGTGKTSLIQCGLANQFGDRDWLPLTIRRGGGLLQSLRDALETAARTRIPATEPIRKVIRSLYLDYYRPVYLIFDQFEELFILGDEAEQIEFFEAIREVLLSELQCKILLSIRGEYLDKLSRYELVIPSLLDNRQYLEKMSRRNLYEVITQTCENFGIIIKAEDETVNGIIDNITDAKGGVELANLQIYLDKLYRNDLKRRDVAQRPIQFDPELVADTHQLENVLSDFLREQLAQLETELNERGWTNRGAALDVLFTLVTEDGTKRTTDTDWIKTQLQRRKQIPPELVDYCIQRFHELRLIRLMSETGNN